MKEWCIENPVMTFLLTALCVVCIEAIFGHIASIWRK